MMNGDPMLLQNTLAQTGQATAIVAAVGRRTQSGRAERLLDIQDVKTPLQMKLVTIADLIGKLGGTVALLTFIVLIVKMLLLVFLFKNRTISDP